MILVVVGDLAPMPRPSHLATLWPLVGHIGFFFQFEQYLVTQITCLEIRIIEHHDAQIHFQGPRATGAFASSQLQQWVCRTRLENKELSKNILLH